MSGFLRVLLASGFGVAVASADTIGVVGGIAAKTLTQALSRNLVAVPVPEPSAFVVLGLGVALAAGLRRRARKISA